MQVQDEKPLIPFRGVATCTKQTLNAVFLLDFETRPRRNFCLKNMLLRPRELITSHKNDMKITTIKPKTKIKKQKTKNKRKRRFYQVNRVKTIGKRVKLIWKTVRTYGKFLAASLPLHLVSELNTVYARLRYN